MLAERGWFSENMERAREIGRLAPASSTAFIDLTSEDVNPRDLFLDFQSQQAVSQQVGSQQVETQPVESRVESQRVETEQVESWRFESRRFQAMEQEKAMQEKSLQEKTANTQWFEENTNLRVQEFAQQTSVKEEKVDMAKGDSNVETVTVIDLDTDDDAEEPSSDMSMALVVVPDPEPVKILNHCTELAIVREDNAETRETTSQSNGSPTMANELSVARQCPPGNGQVQAPTAGDWAEREPRWPSTTVGILSVQCARCRKWRVVPSREKYEEIREHILETPWVCEHGSEWRPDANCDHPADLNQDSESVWALDKPNLPSSPPGWSRKVVVRRDCSTRFADVYYTAPGGKTLRSSVEVGRYLEENPDSVPPGTRLSQFSFTSPRPLPGVWVAKKRNKTKSLMTHSSSQECKKAKTAQPLAKQLAHKLLHGTPPPSLPVAPSSPSYSTRPYPLPVGASFPAPSLGPDLVQFVAMQAPSYPPAPNFLNAQNVPLFTSALPLRQCSPPRSRPLQQASSPLPWQGVTTSNAGNPMLGPALAALRMKQQLQQQQQSRLRGASTMSQPVNLPGLSPLGDLPGLSPLRDLSSGIQDEPRSS